MSLLFCDHYYYNFSYSSLNCYYYCVINIITMIDIIITENINCYNITFFLHECSTTYLID